MPPQYIRGAKRKTNSKKKNSKKKQSETTTGRKRKEKFALSTVGDLKILHKMQKKYDMKKAAKKLGIGSTTLYNYTKVEQREKNWKNDYNDNESIKAIIQKHKAKQLTKDIYNDNKLNQGTKITKNKNSKKKTIQKK